jgi:G:T-mismatch repair DNA endonuclease (very short patch repair protein)
MTTLENYLNLLDLDHSTLNLNSNSHKRRGYIRSIINNEILIDAYIKNEMSAKEIADTLIKFNIKTEASYVIARLKEAGVKTRTAKQSSLCKRKKEKYLQTVQQKYGKHITNISQVESVKQKKIQKALEVYGVENVFQSEEIKKKSRQTCKKKYGARQFSQSEYYNPDRSDGSRSKLHQKIEKILDRHQIEYVSELHGKFNKYNHTLEREYSPRPDIYIKNLNLILEINGNYWHANPKKYVNSDLFQTWDGTISAEDIWLRDKIKILHFESFGVNVETIWEDEAQESNVLEIIKKYEDKN